VRSPVWSFLAEGRGELQSCKVWKPEAEVQPYKGVLPAGGCYDVAGKDSVSGGRRCCCCVAAEKRGVQEGAAAEAGVRRQLWMVMLMVRRLWLCRSCC
jgi:hypothetical protein